MNRPHWRFCLVIAAGLMIASGCKPKEEPSAALAGTASPPDSIAAVTAMTRGMRPVPLASLSHSHIGKACVVAAQSPEGGTQIAPPPPPLGMVYIMGPTTVYKGQLCAVSADTVEIQAPYPTSNKVKIVPIPRASIQSVHLAP